MANQERIIGLVKFFSNEQYMKDLLAGKFFCNTPEYYRRTFHPGISDRYESCKLDLINTLDPDFSLKIQMPGYEMLHATSADDLTRFTIYDDVGHQAWLHCWMILSLPPAQKKLDQLICDMRRIKREFGSHNLFLPFKHIKTMASRIKKSSLKEAKATVVKYSDKQIDFSSSCKSTRYSYQREFRFLFGHCEGYEAESFTFQIPEGLGDLLAPNADLKLTDNQTGRVWFDLQNS